MSTAGTARTASRNFAPTAATARSRAANVVGKGGIVDVEFGDRHRQAALGEAGDIAGESGIVGWPLRPEMALQADRVDGRAGVEQAIDKAGEQRPDRTAPFVVVVALSLVEREPRILVDRRDAAERALDIRRAHRREPRSVAPAAGPAVHRPERLVDHVPGDRACRRSVRRRGRYGRRTRARPRGRTGASANRGRGRSRSAYARAAACRCRRRSGRLRRRRRTRSGPAPASTSRTSSPRRSSGCASRGGRARRSRGRRTPPGRSRRRRAGRWRRPRRRGWRAPSRRGRDGARRRSRRQRCRARRLIIRSTARKPGGASARARRVDRREAFGHVERVHAARRRETPHRRLAKLARRERVDAAERKPGRRSRRGNPGPGATAPPRARRGGRPDAPPRRRSTPVRRRPASTVRAGPAPR